MEQKFKRQLSPEEKVRRYYIVLMALNDIQISKQQMELLVFTAVEGKLDTDGRKKFASLNSTSPGTVDNCVSALKKTELLVEVDGHLQPNPFAFPKKQEDIILHITFTSSDAEAIH